MADLSPDRIMSIVREIVKTPEKRVGSDYKILCPFHPDNKPSFAINPKKGDTGIFKCWGCAWGGDLFDFVEDVLGLDGFKPSLEYIAGVLGIVAPTGVRGAGPRSTEKIERKPVDTYMTPTEVAEAMRALRKQDVPTEPWCERLGIDPRALDMAGGCVADLRGRMVLAVPMRDHKGTLISIRFRDFETKKRWSVDVKERQPDGTWEQVKSSRSGLLTIEDFFDEERCVDGQLTIDVEGESDMLAGTTMMLRQFGADTSEWPAIFVGLPGAMACHEMLCLARTGVVHVTFLDTDNTGRTATFDHRRMKNEDGQKVLDLDSPPVPALLSRLREAGKKAMAAFPPEREEKFDLRDMVREGWGWSELKHHIATTAVIRPAALIGGG